MGIEGRGSLYESQRTADEYFEKGKLYVGRFGIPRKLDDLLKWLDPAQLREMKEFYAMRHAVHILRGDRGVDHAVDGRDNLARISNKNIRDLTTTFRGHNPNKNIVQWLQREKDVRSRFTSKYGYEIVTLNRYFDVQYVFMGNTSASYPVSEKNDDGMRNDRKQSYTIEGYAALLVPKKGVSIPDNIVFGKGTLHDNYTKHFKTLQRNAIKNLRKKGVDTDRIARMQPAPPQETDSQHAA